MTRSIIKQLLLFLLFFISIVFVFTINRGDTFVNFGFSYAISLGEVPYKDFNMVISPLAPFLYSIGLLISKNILVFYAEQALLLTVFYNIVEKLLKKKTPLFLLLFLMPFPIAMSSTLFPGYNFLILLLFILFIYYFKNRGNDYLLGILLGLIFCTKQTIGIILFLPTFYYLFTDRKKFFKMFVGYLVPCLILFIYLLLANNLFEFIDLCFLGLFDFQNNNSNCDFYYLFLAIGGVIFIIYKIIKDKNNILLYYILFFSAVILPIIDYYHVSLFLVIVFYLFVDSTKYDFKYNKIFLLIIILICILWSFITVDFFGGLYIKNLNNFSLFVTSREYYDDVEKTKKYLTTLDKEVIYFMRGSENYFFKIMNNERIYYFDLPNYGNYGYNGIKMMKRKIDSEHEVYFVLDRVLVKNNDNNQQYIKELGQYVMNNSKKIKTIGVYEIYYKE